MQNDVTVITARKQKAFAVTQRHIPVSFDDNNLVYSRLMRLDKPNLSHVATHLISIFKPIYF
jgi:hypothetical protein